jgi:hypothetical protein
LEISMTRTAIAEAFEAAGVDEKENDLLIAMARFLNRGGTRDKLMEIAKYACLLTAQGVLSKASLELSGEGQSFSATQNGQRAIAPSDKPIDGGEGQARNARMGQRFSAPSLSTPKARGEDQSGYASHGHHAAVPREPSPEHKAAMSKVVRHLSIFDTFKISDGRTLQHVWSDEWEKLRGNGFREGWLFDQLIKHCTPTVPMRTSECITEDVLKRMIQKAAEMADAAD